MHEKNMDQLSLPRRDHNAKQDWQNTMTKSKTRLNTKRPVVETTKPHKIRITPAPPP